jgi:hypothetical protein
MLAFEPDVADTTIFSPLVGWWIRTLSSTGRLPSRSALRPEDLPGIAFSHLLLAELVEGGQDMLCHLIGDQIRSIVSTDWKGRLASSSAAGVYFRDYLRPLYQEMAQTRRPIRTLTSLDLGGSLRIVIARLILPLCADEASEEVRFVLGAICLHAPSVNLDGKDVWRDVQTFHELERVVL